MQVTLNAFALTTDELTRAKTAVLSILEDSEIEPQHRVSAARALTAMYKIVLSQEQANVRAAAVSHDVTAANPVDVLRNMKIVG